MKVQSSYSRLVNDLANLGIRAPDLEAETAFLRVFGASEPVRFTSPSDGSERVQIILGSTRFAMFRQASYDQNLLALGETRGGGLSHVAFDVEDVDRVLLEAKTHGVTPLLGPFVSGPSSGGPARKVCFFRSPNGTIIEPQQLIKQ